MIDIVYLGYTGSPFTRYFAPTSQEKRDYQGILDAEEPVMLDKWLDTYGLGVLYRGVRKFTFADVVDVLMEFNTYPGYANIGCIVIDISISNKNQLIKEWNDRRESVGGIDYPRIVLSSWTRFENHPVCDYVGSHLRGGVDTDHQWCSHRDIKVRTWVNGVEMPDFSDRTPV